MTRGVVLNENGTAAAIMRGQTMQEVQISGSIEDGGLAIVEAATRGRWAVRIVPWPVGAGGPILSLVAALAALWATFWGVFQALPYIRPGAELVFGSKVSQIEHAAAPGAASLGSQRLVIFGNSKVLAGFVPDRFDNLAAQHGMHVLSCNEGFPARDVFVPQLKRMAETGNAPDILLLTLPWRNEQRRDLFHILPNDHDLADLLFPFRYMIRDTLSFVLTARRHGGLSAFYSEARRNVDAMTKDRGYYFISEQSRYPGDRLPDDFHLPTDQPSQVAYRTADTGSSELTVLNSIIRREHIRCYFVPVYFRVGERAPAPTVDRAFSNLVAQYSACTVLGPSYVTYPLALFADPVHVNRRGAAVYTDMVFSYVARALATKE